MWVRRMIALITAAAFGWASTAAASARTIRHHRRGYVAQYVAPPPQPPPYYYGARLVKHPAFNIACQTPYVSTRPLPCDQPVWVYGSPCEVDLGLGRYKDCD